MGERRDGVDGTVGTASLGLAMIVVVAAMMVAMAGVWVDGSNRYRHARERKRCPRARDRGDT